MVGTRKETQNSVQFNVQLLREPTHRFAYRFVSSVSLLQRFLIYVLHSFMPSHHSTTSTLAFMHALSIINIHHQLHFPLIINVISTIMSH